MPGVRIAAHAVDRWIQRVEPAASRLDARASILAMLAGGRTCERPPKWCRQSGIRPEPGQVLIAYHERPGVVLLLSLDTVVTVWTKATGARHRQRRRLHLERDQPSRKPAVRARRRLAEVEAEEAWADER